MEQSEIIASIKNRSARYYISVLLALYRESGETLGPSTSCVQLLYLP